MRKYFWLLLILIITCVSCRNFIGRRVHGNGQIKTEDKNISAFKRLEVHGSVNVHLTQGSSTTMKITGDDNLLPYIEISQQGDALIIDQRHGYNLAPTGDMHIEISNPSYSDIQLSGASSITTDGKLTGTEPLEIGLSGAGNMHLDLDVPKIKADISGVGSMYVKGQTKEEEFGLSGVGSAHCYELQSESADVSVSGVGSAEVSASVKLNAQVSGIGSIKYRGNPASIDQHVSGVGSIKKED